MTTLTVEQVNDLCDAIKTAYTTIGGKISDPDVRASYAKMPPMIDSLRDLALAALSERGGETPIAYGVRNDQGYWAGCWNDLATAEAIRAKGQPSHHEVVIPLYTRPQAVTVSEQNAELAEELEAILNDKILGPEEWRRKAGFFLATKSAVLLAAIRGGRHD